LSTTRALGAAYSTYAKERGVSRALDYFGNSSAYITLQDVLTRKVVVSASRVRLAREGRQTSWFNRFPLFSGSWTVWSLKGQVHAIRCITFGRDLAERLQSAVLGLWRWPIVSGFVTGPRPKPLIWMVSEVEIFADQRVRSFIAAVWIGETPKTGRSRGSFAERCGKKPPRLRWGVFFTEKLRSCFNC